MIHEFSDHIKQEAPELWESFLEQYEEPKLRLVKGDLEYDTWACNRCGGLAASRKKHRAWHRELSLAIFALGATSKMLGQLIAEGEKEN